MWVAHLLPRAKGVKRHLVRVRVRVRGYGLGLEYAMRESFLSPQVPVCAREMAA